MKRTTLLLVGTCLIAGIIISCEQAQVITPEKLSILSMRTQSQLSDETSNLQDRTFYLDINNDNALEIANHSLEIININPGFEGVRTISQTDCPTYCPLICRIDTLYDKTITHTVTGIQIVPTLESMPYISGFWVNSNINAHDGTYHYATQMEYSPNDPAPDAITAEFYHSRTRVASPKTSEEMIHIGVYVKNEILGKITGYISGKKYYPHIGVLSNPIESFNNSFNSCWIIDNVIRNNNVSLTIKNKQNTPLPLKVTISKTTYSHTLTIGAKAEETLSIPISYIDGRLGVIHIGAN